MSSQESDNSRPAGIDGWVKPASESAEDRPEGRSPEVGQRRSTESIAGGRDTDLLACPDNSSPLQQAAGRTDDVADGKAMAVLAHLSILFGLPVFALPMLQRNNAFALHHARAAAVSYGLFLVCVVLSFLTAGLALPLAFLWYVPALVGIVNAVQGEEAGCWGLGGWGQRLFGWITVDVTGHT